MNLVIFLFDIRIVLCSLSSKLDDEDDDKEENGNEEENRRQFEFFDLSFQN